MSGVESPRVAPPDTLAAPVPPSGPPAFDAFISYHSGDAEWVGTLVAALEARGVRVWIDSEQLRPGNLFPGALAAAIESIGCVVLVLSRGAIASAWVEEEFSLALTHRRQVVPVLIDDVEPPGFVAGRTWVDFRDPSAFAVRIDDLVFGVTGRRSGGTTGPAPAFRDAASATGGGDEAAILQRLIARRRADERRLWAARAVSVVAGVALGATCFVAAGDASSGIRLALLVLGGSIPPVAGWGATARGLSRLSQKVEQFEVMRDGLDACRSRSHPGCMKLRQHFWDMLTRTAAEAGMDLRPA
jgi:hypothetical protein